MSIEKLKNVSIHSSTPDLSFLFDIKSILKDTPDKSKLSVTLKHQPIKGNSLFATKPIQKGDTIAYYKMKVFTDVNYNYNYKNKFTGYTKQELKHICDELGLNYPVDASKCQLKELLLNNIVPISYKGKGIKMPYKNMYHFTISSKNDGEYPKLVGDLYKGSLPSPKNNIPYWGYFANEPFYGLERSNVEVDSQTYENFTKKGRTKIKEGDTVTYAVVATRLIHPGEEILWNYGNSYNRSYKAGMC
jgi:hypothetical protein